MKKNIHKILVLFFLLLIVINNKYTKYYLFTNFIYEDIKPKDIEKLLNENDKSKNIILVGRKSCKSCIDLISEINNEIKSKTDINTIYYYDTDKYRNNDLFEDIANRLNLTTIPAVILIERGVITN